MDEIQTTEKQPHEEPKTLLAMQAFLSEFANHCNVGRSCAAAGISRSTAYRWRQEDAWFAAKYETAKRVALTALEDEMHRRAYEGTDKPVFHKGEICGAMREYSDTLAIFLAKAHDPEKYRERSDVTLSISNLPDALEAARQRVLNGSGSET